MRKCWVKKVPKKMFLVQKNILLTFGMANHCRLGHSTSLFHLHPFLPMKNFFLATCIAAGVSAAPIAVAGPGDREYSPAMVTRATTLTRALAHRIHFNEGQYLAVKQLHLEMLTERRDLEDTAQTGHGAESATPGWPMPSSATKTSWQPAPAPAAGGLPATCATTSPPTASR